MNKLLFAVAGFMMAAALVVAAPGTAKATPMVASVTIMSGTSNTTVTGTGTTGTISIAEGVTDSWALVGQDASGNQIGSNVVISGGNITLDNTTHDVTFTGSIASAPAFAITGTLTGYSPGLNGPGASTYSWGIAFGNGSNFVSALSGNGQFDLSGNYSGSLSITQNTQTLTSGSSGMSFDVSRSAVPVPPSVFLLVPGLLGLVGMRKRFNG